MELLRAPPSTYYAYADMDLVRRGAALTCLVVALATLVVLPFNTPTGHLGGAGWALGSLAVLVGIGLFAWLARGPERVGVDAIWYGALVALVVLGALQWLAGGDAYYQRIVTIVLVYTGAVHTARRVAVAVAIAIAVQIPSMLPAFGASQAVGLAVRGFVWLAIGALAVFWTAAVRFQRAQMLELEAQALRLARVDPLTGLGNRRAFDEAVDTELARAERGARPLSLLVADLDGFKAINDRHGHLAGDRCLRAVAAVVRAAVRRPDACFRWGGDEFVVLLPEADIETATTVGTRVAEGAVHDCTAPDGGTLTLSFGVSELRPDESGESLLSRADLALLSAKLSGGGGETVGVADRDTA